MNLLDGVQFKILLQSGANHLTNRHAEIDALNVFPVPDGDTGTNMSLTFSSGVKDADAIHSENISDIAKGLSKGLLMGARGNSGVITSQIFRGFYQGVEHAETVDVTSLALAFVKGSEIAYKAVMRPVEGTILTVIRESSNKALKRIEGNDSITIEEYFDILLEEANISLEHTPELLPVLKEVGVVDSGGAGLVAIIEGFVAALKGNPIKLMEGGATSASAALDVDNDEFGYCTEFIIRLSEGGRAIFNEDKMKKNLARMGDSVVVVQDEELVKVHVHTLTPGDALNLAQRFGEFVKLKIENMQEQHNTILQEKLEPVAVEKKPYAIISVAAGDGLKKLFEEYRVDVVISGGQTMNPSTEDFVEAIKKCNAEHLFILPNNSNIILAAQQAKLVCEDLAITVLETKSIPQGLSACIMFNPEVSVAENIEEMNRAIKRVVTGQVTYAIKDTTFDGLEINAQDYMGIAEKDIVIATPSKIEAACRLLDKLVFDEAEIITMIIGEDASEEEVTQIETYITDTFNLELDIQKGNQPVYSFIFGVE